MPAGRVSRMMHYDEEKFRMDFPGTEIGRKITSETPDWLHIDYSPTIPLVLPRQYMLTLDVVPFFYIQMLLEKNPDSVLDLGCGHNFYKNFIPEIHGVDPVDYPEVDEIGSLDDGPFAQANRCRFDGLIAINSIHFIPLSGLADQIKRAIMLVKPGGRLYIALNVSRMLELTPDEEIVPLEELSSYVHQQVKRALNDEPGRSAHTILAYDDYINGSNLDNPINGNIRMVIEKGA